MSEISNDELKQLLINLIEEENDNDYVVDYFRTIWPMDKVAATFTECFEEYMCDKLEDYFNDEKDDTRSVEDVLENFVKIAETNYWNKKRVDMEWRGLSGATATITHYTKPFKRGRS
jgi:hypothetical protein